MKKTPKYDKIEIRKETLCMNPYFEKLNQNHFHPNIIKLEKYAEEHHVPIIKKDALLVVLQLLHMANATHILELGTAIGYSSICMAYQSNRHVDTIERDSHMVKLARQNISVFGLDSQIEVIFQDALEVDPKILSTYDLIFIDAAKAQNIKFFEKFSPLLKENGMIITDNLLFHGAVENNENLTKNVRKMVEKIDAYNHYLQNLDKYQTYFLEVGDGIAITTKVK